VGVDRFRFERSNVEHEAIGPGYTKSHRRPRIDNVRPLVPAISRGNQPYEPATIRSGKWCLRGLIGDLVSTSLSRPSPFLVTSDRLGKPYPNRPRAPRSCFPCIPVRRVMGPPTKVPNPTPLPGPLRRPVLRPPSVGPTKSSFVRNIRSTFRVHL
jgi:hypothetical protein